MVFKDIFMFFICICVLTRYSSHYLDYQLYQIYSHHLNSHYLFPHYHLSSYDGENEMKKEEEERRRRDGENHGMHLNHHEDHPNIIPPPHLISQEKDQQQQPPQPQPPNEKSIISSHHLFPPFDATYNYDEDISRSKLIHEEKLKMENGKMISKIIEPISQTKVIGKK